MTTIEAADYQARQTEAEFQRAVEQAAEVRGWLALHFPNMVGNPAGWPDLLLLRNNVAIVAELKRENGRVSRRQAEWLERLRSQGFAAYVWRPSDWPEIEGVLEGVL